MQLTKLLILFSAIAVGVAVASPRPADDETAAAAATDEAPTVDFVADTDGSKGGKYPNYGGKSPYGYEKPKFAYPSLCKRVQKRCRSIKHKIGHFFHKVGGKIHDFFHSIKKHLKEEWAKCKSDHERRHYWWHCKKAEFKRYLYLRRQIALNRKLKLAEYQVQKLRSLIDFCHHEKDKCGYRAGECKTAYPDQPYPDYSCDNEEPVYTPPASCPKYGGEHVEY